MNRILFSIFWAFVCLSLFSNNTNYSQPPTATDSIIMNVLNKNLSLNERYAAAISVMYLLPYEDIVTTWMPLIEDAQKEGDDRVPLLLYAQLVDQSRLHLKFDKAKEYLDIAFALGEKTDYNRGLFSIHQMAGLYYHDIQDKEKAHDYYYKAIEYAEKEGDLSGIIIFKLLHLISFEYSIDPDTTAFKTILDRMLHYKTELNDPSVDALYHLSQGRHYYVIANLLSEEGKEDPEYLRLKESAIDSVVMHTLKGIDIMNNEDVSELMNTYTERQHFLNASYSRLAQIELKRQAPDYNKSLEYVHLAEAFVNEANPVTNWNTSITKMNIYYHLKDYPQVITEALLAIEQLEILATDTISAKRYDIAFKDTYSLLSKAYAESDDYPNAYKYLALEKKYTDQLYKTEKFEITKELETQYDVKLKEQEITALNEENKNRKQVQLLSLGIAISLGVILVITTFLARQRRRATLKDAEEAKLKVRLKEEEARLSEMEKYEALSAIYLKDLEIYGKDTELIQLQKTKEALDEEIKHYSEKLKAYEEEKKSKNTDFKPILAEGIVNELTVLVTKRIDHAKFQEKYLMELSAVNDLFISQVQKMSGGLLSSVFTKYCILFAIQMDMKDIANCLSVEMRTAYMARYRLKKKFNLKAEDDLDVFLRSLLKQGI